jgi:hypothetical protein
MEDRLIKLILEANSEYQTNMIWILAGCFLLITVIQAVVQARIIDGFRSDLKKSEMRFSTYNELQIKALSAYYEKASSLLRTTDRIMPIVKRDGHPTTHYKTWIDRRKILEVSYADHKYVFPEIFHKQLDVLHKKMATLDRMSYLQTCIVSLYTDDTQRYFAYGEAQEELKEYRDEMAGFNFAAEYEWVQSNLLEVQNLIVEKFGKFE